MRQRGVAVGISRAVFGAFRFGRRAVEIRHIRFGNIAFPLGARFVRIGNVIVFIIQPIDLPQYFYGRVFGGVQTVRSSVR